MPDDLFFNLIRRSPVRIRALENKAYRDWLRARYGLIPTAAACTFAARDELRAEGISVPSTHEIAVRADLSTRCVWRILNGGGD